MHRHRAPRSQLRLYKRLCVLFAFLLIALLLWALLNWNNAAVPGKGLPAPFDRWDALDAPMNAAALAAPARPALVIVRDADGRETAVRVRRFEGIAIDPLEQYAARAELTQPVDPADAARVLDPDSWTDGGGEVLTFGKPENAWAETARTAWTQERRVSWARREPAAWRGWRLLPDDAPSPLMALGFLRSRADLVDRTFAAAGVNVEGLGGALRLARMNVTAFGIYGAFGNEPIEVSAPALREAGMGVIAVAESAYPAFVVSALWGRASATAGLAPTTVDGEPAHYRDLDGWHLVALRYGKTLYAAVGASRPEAESLARAIIASQRTRRAD